MQSYFCFLFLQKKKFVFLLFLFLLTRFIYRILLCVSFGVCWCFPFTSEMFILFMRAHLSGTYHIHYVSTRVLSFSTPLLLKRTFKNGTAFGIFMEMYRLFISNSNQYIYISRPLNAKYDRQSHKYKGSHLAKNPATHFPNCFGKYFVLADAKIYPHM